MGRIAMRCFGWYSTARSERIAETGLIVLALAKCGEELDSGFALRWTVGAGEYSGTRTGFKQEAAGSSLLVRLRPSSERQHSQAMAPLSGALLAARLFYNSYFFSSVSSIFL